MAPEVRGSAAPRPRCDTLARRLRESSRVSHEFNNPSTEGHAVRGWGGVDAPTTRRGVRQAFGAVPPRRSMIPSQAFSATLPRAIKGPQTASPTGQLQILVPPRGRIFLRTSSFRHTRSPPVPAPALPDHPILSHPPPHPVGFSDRWIFQKTIKYPSTTPRIPWSTGPGAGEWWFGWSTGSVAPAIAPPSPGLSMGPGWGSVAHCPYELAWRCPFFPYDHSA